MAKLIKVHIAIVKHYDDRLDESFVLGARSKPELLKWLVKLVRSFEVEDKKKVNRYNVLNRLELLDYAVDITWVKV